MKPSVGRIIHYNGVGDGEIRPAIITKVLNDTCINLFVFGIGSPYDPLPIQTSVGLGLQPGQWHWPERI